MEDILKNEAYQFYPKGISSIYDQNAYKESVEYKRLEKKLKNRKLDKKIEELRGDLEQSISKEVFDFSLFSWHDRCYNLQFLINKIENRSYVFCLNISVITNYYTFYTLEVEESAVEKMMTNFPKRTITLLSTYSKSLEDNVSTILSEKISFNKFQ